MTPADTTLSNATRGRPPIVSDEVILDAALDAFAEAGFDAMSLRSLSRDLGLAHGSINQRFTSKDELFRAAVRHGFGQLVAEIETARSIESDASVATSSRRAGIRAFLLASAKQPQLLRLMNHEGIASSDRLDLVFDEFIAPVLSWDSPTGGGGDGTTALNDREVFFLVVHGAAAPFTLAALSSRFDSSDGALDPIVHAERMAAFLDAALSADPPSN